MYSYEERRKAIELYIKYDLQVNPVIKELGYPSRRILYKWYKEYIEKAGFPEKHTRKSKYSDEQKRLAVEYYFNHGRTLAHTIRTLGYPSKITLRSWIDEASPVSTKRCNTSKYTVRYSQDKKKQAVFDLCERSTSAENIAKSHEVSRSTIYEWKRKLLGTEKIEPMSKKRDITFKKASESSNTLVDEKTELEQQVETLKKEVFRLQLERDILEKASELLKKGMSINPGSLKNNEKAILIDALKSKYRIKVLLKSLNMAKSSYFYHEKMLQKADKYAEVRKTIERVFNESGKSYGYRRIYAILKKEGTRISEKVIRRIMHEDLLAIQVVKKRKYSSYKGEISPAVDNVINRDFHADKPNEKWLTDITEFHLPAGKVYLSPMIDCFDGMVVTWSIGTSPDATLVNSMLDEAITTLKESEHPIVHSDRGCHYRWPGWITRMNKANLIRSMSKKGCSPDNAACEGLFGRLKNEFFYNQDWKDVTIEEFSHELDLYLHWYNEKRIKKSLGYLSPVEYRRSLGLVT